MEATINSSQDQSGITTNCGEITQNKQLNNSKREPYNLGHTEESASALTD